MTIRSYTLGPGTLTLGETPHAASAQVTNCRLVPSEEVKSEDALPTLDGDELAGSEIASIKWKLEGTVIQDLGATSTTKFSWDNSGDEIPFTFVPSTAEGDSFAGDIRMVPLQVGGDVKKKNTADFSWSVIGTPTPTWG